MRWYPAITISMRGPIPLKNITVAAFVVASLASDIQSAYPADLSVKPKFSRQLDNRQRSIDPIEKEILFQQFLEWLKKRSDHDWKLRGTISSTLSDQAASSVG
jgi:hypothetical protein